MREWFWLLLGFVRNLFRSNEALRAENLALRRELLDLVQQRGRPIEEDETDPGASEDDGRSTPPSDRSAS